MNFLCHLGLHAAAPGAVSNGGYHFTRCRRCASDLVSVSGSGWRVPHRHKVVWKTEAEAARDALLHHQRAREMQVGGPSEQLPVESLLGELYGSHPMGPEPEARSWDTEILVSVQEARARLDRSDFMRPSGADVRASANAEPPQAQNNAAAAAAGGASRS